MKILTTVGEAQSRQRSRPSVLVPTMGALHKAHHPKRAPVSETEFDRQAVPVEEKLKKIVSAIPKDSQIRQVIDPLLFFLSTAEAG